MSKNINELFITDEVRNYIKTANDLMKKGKYVYKNNINFSLYIGLLQFMEKIGKFDIIGIHKLYIEFFKNIINSTENINIKKKKIKEYIKFLELKLVYKKFFIPRIENIKNELENILKNNNSGDNTIEKFIEFLNKDETDKKYLEYHNIIREQLINNSENAYLFLEYFDVIKCDDKNCNNTKIINNYKENDSMFTLKRDGDIIKLLKIFKTENINVVVNEEDMKNIILSKDKYEKGVIELTRQYINKIIESIKNFFTAKGGKNNNQKGGSLLELFNIPKFYELFETMISSCLESLHNSYETFFNKLTGAFKLDWFSEGGISAMGDALVSHDYDDVTDNFAFRIENISDYINNYFNSFFSTFFTNINDQKNFITGTGLNIRNNFSSYLGERSKLQNTSLNGLGLNSVSGKAYNTYSKELLGSIYGMIGGTKNKCLKIPNLRFVMYSALMNTHDIKMEFNISNYKDCDEKIEEEEIYVKSVIESEKFNCLNKTNLRTKNKNNSDKLKVWDINNKNLNYQSPTVFPDYIQILKDTVFPNYLNYQLGGNIDIEKSNKTEIVDINIEHYFDIVDILEKVLKNENIKNENIKNIQEKIINIKKNAEELKKYNKIIKDNNKSLEYKNKQEFLNKKLNNLVLDLNSDFIKMIDLIDK